MIKGKVKSFNTKLGYGFITIKADYRDIIVHYSVIQGNGFKNLIKGQTVYVDYTERNERLLATKVIAIRRRN